MFGGRGGTKELPTIPENIFTSYSVAYNSMLPVHFLHSRNVYFPLTPELEWKLSYPIESSFTVKESIWEPSFSVPACSFDMEPEQGEGSALSLMIMALRHQGLHGPRSLKFNFRRPYYFRVPSTPSVGLSNAILYNSKTK